MSASPVIAATTAPMTSPVIVIASCSMIVLGGGSATSAKATTMPMAHADAWARIADR